MKMFRYPDKKTWSSLVQRPATDQASVSDTVKEIIMQVKKKGDAALYAYAKELDAVHIKNIKISRKEIKDAGLLVSDELKTAIDQAKKNIEIFHSVQKQVSNKIETTTGVYCWRRQVPIEKVGLYIPGGNAPLFSTVLMLAIPAQIAGCPEIILCTPAQKNGRVHPAILYTADRCGISSIYKTGGAQAIAAMAYGTDSIPKVMKIFGPGNRYVTTAKMLLQQEGIAIDMPAGPSELLVIADTTAEPSFIAADLLSQAEHGADSQVILVTTSALLAKKVIGELQKQVIDIPAKAIAKKTLSNSKIILVKNITDAIAFSNAYAPEHLIICCAGLEKIASQVSAAGSVFLGNDSPESAGDYASGTNHTLPTNGFAAMYSGVSVGSFCKTISYQQLTREGLTNLGNTIMTMAQAEGLQAHKNAVAIRLKKYK